MRPLFRPRRLLLLLVAFLIAACGCGAFCTAAEPHPSLPKIGTLEGLGVNIHFTDAKPGELEMIAAAGFKWIRTDLSWAGTERKRGEYDFSAFDRLAAGLEKNGLKAVMILDYGNPLYSAPGEKQPFTAQAGTDEYRQAFARWAVAAVSHFKGKGFLWEMWNEPNHPNFWKPKTDVQQYIALARQTGEALRTAKLTGAGGEAFIGPATSTIDLPFLEACFKAGLLEYWDGVSVHPYRQKGPEMVESEYRQLRLLVQKYAPAGKQIPLLSGEWGYSVAWDGLGKDEATREQQQARYLARQFLTNIANDVALSIWYDWRDDGDNPKEGEHRFGIVRRAYREGQNPPYELKPAYLAAKTLTSQLAGMHFNKRLWLNALTAPIDLYEKGNEYCVVTWNQGSPNDSADTAALKRLLDGRSSGSVARLTLVSPPLSAMMCCFFDATVRTSCSASLRHGSALRWKCCARLPPSPSWSCRCATFFPIRCD